MPEVVYSLYPADITVGIIWNYQLKLPKMVTPTNKCKNLEENSPQKKGGKKVKKTPQNL